MLFYFNYFYIQNHFRFPKESLSKLFWQSPVFINMGKMELQFCETEIPVLFCFFFVDILTCIFFSTIIHRVLKIKQSVYVCKSACTIQWKQKFLLLHKGYCFIQECINTISFKNQNYKLYILRILCKKTLNAIFVNSKFY